MSDPKDVRKFDDFGIPDNPDGQDVDHKYIMDSAFASALKLVGKSSFEGLVPVLEKNKSFQEAMGPGKRKYKGMEIYVFGIQGDYACKGPWVLKEENGFNKVIDFATDPEPYETIGAIMSNENDYNTSLGELADNMGAEDALNGFRPFNEAFFNAFLPTIYETARGSYGMEKSRAIVRFICDNEGTVETIAIWDNKDQRYPISCMKY